MSSDQIQLRGLRLLCLCGAQIRKMRPPVPHELGSSEVRITRRQT